MAIATCIVCGQQFYVRPSVLAAGNGRFCSKPCKGVSMLGNVPGNARHLSSGSPTWKSWDAMRQRCMNHKSKDYARYGGRGIVVCERWHTFDNFLSDMGERPEGMTLGRIDNDGDYIPVNCRWEDARTQSNNRRSSRTITVSGRTLSIAQWARELGTSRQTIRYRLEAGWSPERIVQVSR